MNSSSPANFSFHGRNAFYFDALKTLSRAIVIANRMVVLGPSFLDAGESFLLGWQATTVLSFGKDHSIFLPTEATVWAPRPLDRSQVWLAVAEERTFICTNGGHRPTLLCVFC